MTDYEIIVRESYKRAPGCREYASMVSTAIESYNVKRYIESSIKEIERSGDILRMWNDGNTIKVLFEKNKPGRFIRSFTINHKRLHKPIYDDSLI